MAHAYVSNFENGTRFPSITPEDNITKVERNSRFSARYNFYENIEGAYRWNCARRASVVAELRRITRTRKIESAANIERRRFPFDVTAVVVEIISGPIRRRVPTDRDCL